MNKLDIKIAFRAFLKGKWYNLLNIAGLAMGLAAFIFVTLYVDHETSYDQWNTNTNRIFLVELELPDGPSPYTPGLLAAEIKNQCPEVEEAGRTNTAPFKIPFHTASGTFIVEKWVGADYSIAKILGIKPEGFTLNPNSDVPTTLLSKSTAAALFPNDEAVLNKTVTMMSKSGLPLNIAGTVADRPGNSHFDFDCLAFAQDITSGKDASYTNRIYQTYLLVKPNTDIDHLSKKIDGIYKKAVLADSSQVAKEAALTDGKLVIYLDPLKNLHLKPHYGSHVNYHIVQSLIILAIIILVVTGVNFTNLYIAQASSRSKEVGIKKVSGVNKRNIALQFLLEIFVQCCLALLIAFVLVLIGLPYFNQLLQVDLLLSGINRAIIIQLAITLIALTLLAGIYPSLVMARFKPTEVLRGDQLSTSGKLSWVRSSITVLQFTFAIAFIISMILINQQVKYMKTEDPGFKATEVLYIDNLMLYNSPRTFEPVRHHIKSIPGVKYVTVASNIPGGIAPTSYEYTIRGKALAMHTISVDYEYFETLNIEKVQGTLFRSSSPADSVNAVINETAARALGISNPIGLSIEGCSGRYKIIGIVKDVKAYGFEEKIQPTMYLMKDNCGLSKTQIMISVEGTAIPRVLKTLSGRWKDINELDGDNFNYHFLDELYGQLFIKQEQLRMVLIFFSGLAIAIASLGLFSSAAHSIRLRMKEIAIRKVFGANAKELIVLVSKPFFKIVIIANLIAWPVTVIIIDKWLETFAYRISISMTPFLVAMIVSFVVVTSTVCLRVANAIRFNPAHKLKQ